MQALLKRQNSNTVSTATEKVIRVNISGVFVHFIVPCQYITVLDARNSFVLVRYGNLATSLEKFTTCLKGHLDAFLDSGLNLLGHALNFGFTGTVVGEHMKVTKAARAESNRGAVSTGEDFVLVVVRARAARFFILIRHSTGTTSGHFGRPLNLDRLLNQLDLIGHSAVQRRNSE